MNINKLIVYNQENINNLRDKNNKIIKYKDKSYKILSKWGKGSFGVVYKVKDMVNEKICVLKSINISNLKQKYKDNVLNEAKLLKNFNHKNIIKYITSFKINSNLYIIMDHATNGDLYNYIKYFKENKKNFGENQIWLIIKQLSSALYYWHKNNIIHRDVKTLNIFLDKNNNILLGDFGVSKMIKQELLAKETRVGTPLYLAPELIKNNMYDYKVDMWALGIVIFQLCNLQYPFKGKNLISLGYNIVNDKPIWLNNNISKELKNLCFKCLEKNSINRPSSECLYKICKNKLEVKNGVKIENEVKIDNITDIIDVKDKIKKIEIKPIKENNNLMKIENKKLMSKNFNIKKEVKNEVEISKNNIEEGNKIPDVINKKLYNLNNKVINNKLNKNLENIKEEKKIIENKNNFYFKKKTKINNNIFINTKINRPLSNYQKVRNINQNNLENNKMYKIIYNNFHNRNNFIPKLPIKKREYIVQKNEKKIDLNTEIKNDIKVSKIEENLNKNNKNIDTFNTIINDQTNDNINFCLHFGDYYKIEKKPINKIKNRPQTALNNFKNTTNKSNKLEDYKEDEKEKQIIEKPRKNIRPHTAIVNINKNCDNIENHNLFRFNLKNYQGFKIPRKNTIRDL